MNFSSFNAQIMIYLIERIAQSKKTVSIDETLIIIVTIAKFPAGSGSVLDNCIIKKNCVIKIINNDNFCALRLNFNWY